MAEPKQKLSSTRTDRRRHRWHTQLPAGIKCPRCQALTKRQAVCPSCGYFKGNKVL